MNSFDAEVQSIKNGTRKAKRIREEIISNNTQK